MAEISWGQMVPLEDYGCVLRLEWHYKNIRTFVPYAVTPLVQIRSRTNRGGYKDIELVPGFDNIGVSEEDHKKLNGLFFYTTYCEFTADAENDCAYFGPSNEKFPNGLPVMIDRTDARGTSTVEINNYNRSFLRSRLGNLWSHRYGDLATADLYRRVQIERYSDLIGLGRGLLTASDDEKDSQATVFWNAMYAATQAKDRYGKTILGKAWTKAQTPRMYQNQEEKLGNVRNASQNYALQLRADPFHAAILKA